MKKGFLITFSLLLVIALFNTLTYYLIGKNRLHTHYFADHENYVPKQTAVGILTIHPFNNSEKKEIRHSLKNQYDRVVFVSDSIDWNSNYRVSDSIYAIEYKIQFNAPFKATVYSGNGALFYGENWETRYFWCFIGWVLLSNENKGQS